MAKRAISYEEQEEFFGLVCSGLSLQRAATGSGVSVKAGSGWWRRSGLMSPVIQLGRDGGLPGSAPARVPDEPRRDGRPRQRRALTSEDRSAIAVALRCGCTYQQVGDLIGRDKSVIWREVNRNRGPDGSYWGPVAHRAAHERRRRPKRRKLARNPGLCRWIEDQMDQGWSPRLIGQVLRRDHPHESMRRVGHETIYQTLYVQGRGELRKDLYRQLSLKRQQRKPRGHTTRATSPYVEAFKISDRPAEAADRAVPGHWEGDLIVGPASKSAIGTLVERSTRFTILLHLPGRHDAASVAEAMIREMSQLPEHLRRSITWDRGTELAEWERIQLELNTTLYFCDPRSPWQRGTNENTNRLLRHWFEKGSDLRSHTADDLRRIADSLNRRPRPTLDLQTPADRLAALLTNPAAA
ncbi:IS30 family transposase [Nocardioides sp. J2M5]|uniref:IS30 family transposase n=1 Tax=Nocardioides palaemonis TaxID=2829810 RepID=UPI001BA4DD1C|nr:IS30 family transposase [Nocardioides palaemonis]MBS2937066.1 IS30 family transposase [Nocardioides palaemonis]